jgi:hypothetical protein
VGGKGLDEEEGPNGSGITAQHRDEIGANAVGPSPSQRRRRAWVCCERNSSTVARVFVGTVQVQCLYKHLAALHLQLGEAECRDGTNSCPGD